MENNTSKITEYHGYQLQKQWKTCKLLKIQKIVAFGKWCNVNTIFICRCEL